MPETDDDFYSRVHIVLTLNETDDHYHIPLLLSHFGHITDRGS
ncbi:MAG: hydroxyisourate hydrolase [Acidobacteria bacterium]|nr:hydroxyisourate hydrolase [Acidobacteriota bacterium]MCZ6504419.1 hydroxyisourate hydrolase [Actinomycetota bacterium]MCZ6738977.1 hydroxyisourate hydrolase [Actinomycetota bacterium]